MSHKPKVVTIPNPFTREGGLVGKPLFVDHIRAQEEAQTVATVERWHPQPNFWAGYGGDDRVDTGVPVLHRIDPYGEGHG